MTCHLHPHQPRTLSQPSTPHFTPHLVDNSEAKMANTWRSIEHQGEIIELDLSLLATLRSRPAFKKYTS